MKKFSFFAVVMVLGIIAFRFYAVQQWENNASKARILCDATKRHVTHALEGFRTDSDSGIHHYGDFSNMVRELREALIVLEEISFVQQKSHLHFAPELKGWGIPVRGEDTLEPRFARDIKWLIETVEQLQASDGKDLKLIVRLCTAVNLINLVYLDEDPAYKL
jgi:hypothetical protein